MFSSFTDSQLQRMPLGNTSIEQVQQCIIECIIEHSRQGNNLIDVLSTYGLDTLLLMSSTLPGLVRGAVQSGNTTNIATLTAIADAYMQWVIEYLDGEHRGF